MTTTTNAFDLLGDDFNFSGTPAAAAAGSSGSKKAAKNRRKKQNRKAKAAGQSAAAEGSDGEGSDDGKDNGADDGADEGETSTATETAKSGAEERKGGERKVSSRVADFRTTLPMLSSSVSAACWSEPDAREFKVRGPQYLTDKVKVDSLESAYELLGVDLFRADERVEHIASRADNIVQITHAAAAKNKTKPPFIFLINFIMPKGNFVGYWSPRHAGPDPKIGDSKFDKMITAFLASSDEQRNSKWKFVPRMIEGNFFVKKAVGENTPAIIGKKLDHKYFKGQNYFEIDCDINSSKVAKGILGVVGTYTKSVVIDLAFMIEAQAPEECPERILGVLRFHKLDPDNAPKLPTSGAGAGAVPLTRQDSKS